MPIKLGERRELKGSFEEAGERYTRVEHVHYSIFTEHAVFSAMIVLIVLSLISILVTAKCCCEVKRMSETWENTVLRIADDKKELPSASDYRVLVSGTNDVKYFIGCKQKDGTIKWSPDPVVSVATPVDFMKTWSN